MVRPVPAEWTCAWRSRRSRRCNSRRPGVRSADHTPTDRCRADNGKSQRARRRTNRARGRKRALREGLRLRRGVDRFRRLFARALGTTAPARHQRRRLQWSLGGRFVDAIRGTFSTGVDSWCTGFGRLRVGPNIRSPRTQHTRYSERARHSLQAHQTGEWKTTGLRRT